MVRHSHSVKNLQGGESNGNQSTHSSLFFNKIVEPLFGCLVPNKPPVAGN